MTINQTWAQVTPSNSVITVQKWATKGRLYINNVADDDTAMIVSGKRFADDVLARQITQTADEPVFLRCENDGDFEVIVEPA